MIEGKALAENIEGLSDAAELALRRLNVPEDKLQELLMALDEAITNVVMYGYDGEKGSIRIEIEERDGCVAASLIDDGKEFDPTGHPAPDLNVPLERRLAGGMGIQLIRRLADGMEYRREGGLNHLTLTKMTGAPNV